MCWWTKAVLYYHFLLSFLDMSCQQPNVNVSNMFLPIKSCFWCHVTSICFVLYKKLHSVPLKRVLLFIQSLSLFMKPNWIFIPVDSAANFALCFKRLILLQNRILWSQTIHKFSFCGCFTNSTSVADLSKTNIRHKPVFRCRHYLNQ